MRDRVLVVIVVAITFALRQEGVDGRERWLQLAEVMLVVLPSDVCQDGEDVLVTQALDVITAPPELAYSISCLV